MGLQALPSVLVLTFIWFIPETPRQYGLQLPSTVSLTREPLRLVHGTR